MDAREVKVFAMEGAVFYLGIYLLLRFADWLSSLLYRFGIIYYLGDWANPRLAIWTYLPSVSLIGRRYFMLNITLNMVFWTFVFVVFGLLWNKIIDLLVLWKVIPEK